jgi:predicted nucleotidyltransferase
LEENLVLTVDEAFRKFKSRLELNAKEQQNASARQQEVRSFLDTRFSIERSFLTGSYARWTKTKPLKDVDIFFQLDSTKETYRDQPPSVVLNAFYAALADKYGVSAVKKQHRSISIDFGVVVDSEDNTDYRIVSVDVVPAYGGDGHYIPDASLNRWIRTNPEVHAEKAVAAHKAYSNEWKGLVRMMKYWNNNPRHGERPVKPSFMIEVMALECLYGGWGGDYAREMQAFFASLADRVHDQWADPAGLGPPVSNGMDAAQKSRARDLLHDAERKTAVAIDHGRRGRNGDALGVWRDLLGPKFPLS